MDPNLLPDNLRGKEDREQFRLKKQPVGFGMELKMPQNDKRPAKAAKAPGIWAGLFGRPVSPIINYTNIEKKPQAAPKAEWKMPAPNLAKTSKPMARRQAGDSWTEIFKNMFGVGRRKRIDFRLASAGGNKQPIIQAHAPSQPEIRHETPPAEEAAPFRAAVLRHEQPSARREKIHEAKASKYHAAPKRERSAEVYVNLMPQELMARLSSGAAGNIKAVIAALVVPAVIITAGFGAIVLLQADLKSRMAEKQQEFNSLQAQIGDFVSQERLNNQTADQVAAVKKLLDEKIIWNAFFDSLEKHTLDGVYFTSLTADTSGVLTLPGVADDYAALARQLAALRDAGDFVKDVKLTNAQLISEGKSGVIGVGFQLRLTLKESVFKKPKISK